MTQNVLVGCKSKIGDEKAYFYVDGRTTNKNIKERLWWG